MGDIPDIRAEKLLKESHGVVSQVHEFSHEDYQLYVFISLTQVFQDANADLDTLLTLRSIAKTVSEQLNKNRAEGLYRSLKTSVETAISHFSNSKLSTHIGAALFSEGFVYYVSSGGPEVRLIREGKLFTLLPSPEKIAGGSGKVLSGDMIFLGDSAVGDLLATHDLSAHPALDEIADEVRTKLAQVEKAVSGGMLLSYRGTVHTQEPEVPQAPPPSVIVPVPPSLKKSFPTKLALPWKRRPRIIVNTNQSDFDASKKTKKISAVGIGLLVLLTASILWGIRQKQTQETEQVLSARIADIETLISDAKRTGALNKSRARELLLEARAQTQTFTEKEKEAEEYKEVIAEIARNMAELAGVYELEGQTFLDLTLQSADFQAKYLVMSDGVMRVLDSARNRVLSVNIDTKRTDVVASTSPQGAIGMSAYADRTFVLTPEGVFETPQNAKVVSADWDTSGSLVATFAGNMYVLSPKDNTIWRFPGVTNGFGEKSAWLAESVSVDLVDARSWAIDGSIWVLSSSGKVVRLSQGVPQTVSVSGLEGSLSGASAIFTDEEETGVYILDAPNSRVIVLDKKGAVQAEYQSSVLKDAQALVVSEKAGRIVVLVGAKLLEIPITHVKP